MYLILMYIDCIDISFEMFTLIDSKGIPVLYCVCVYIYICGNTCVIVTGSCLVLLFVYNKELWNDDPALRVHP